MYYGERFNAWTHLVGAILATIGAIWLIVVAGMQGDPWKIVSFSIYGSTLLLLYSISTLYHSTRGRAKVIMRKLDHLSIYLLIAGSYTPFCLVSLHGPWGWSLFGVVWGLAVIGMLQEIKPRSEARILSIIIYAVMGWIVLVAVNPLLQALGVLRALVKSRPTTAALPTAPLPVRFRCAARAGRGVRPGSLRFAPVRLQRRQGRLQGRSRRPGWRAWHGL